MKIKTYEKNQHPGSFTFQDRCSGFIPEDDSESELPPDGRIPLGNGACQSITEEFADVMYRGESEDIYGR